MGLQVYFLDNLQSLYLPQLQLSSLCSCLLSASLYPCPLSSCLLDIPLQISLWKHNFSLSKTNSSTLTCSSCSSLSLKGTIILVAYVQGILSVQDIVTHSNCCHSSLLSRANPFSSSCVSSVKMNPLSLYSYSTL